MCNMCSPFLFKMEGTCDLLRRACHFGRSVCVFIHEWRCVYSMCQLCVCLVHQHIVFAQCVCVCIRSACVCHHMLLVCACARDTRYTHKSSLRPLSRCYFIFSGGCRGWMAPMKTTCSWAHMCRHSSWAFYLIVSSFPLSCWNLLWRFLICSSETEETTTTWRYVN